MRDRSGRVTNKPTQVLGVQPLLGHPVLHLHRSVLRGDENAGRMTESVDPSTRQDEAAATMQVPVA